MMPTPSNTFHNQSLENWNVSQVTNMHFMFRGAKVSTNPLVVGMSVVFLI
jgi:surface protein